MERLAEQIVDWHNRHPLARRITTADVHTIGVVALPFVRTTAQAGGFVEPVLTDVVSAFDDLHGSTPVSRWAAWTQGLRDLPGRWLRRLGRKSSTQWRAFNEKFLPGLSPDRVERFALAHGFADPPAAPEERPWRVIVIDEALAAQHGGWPFELYLMSAGIDAGSGRTRVLTGRGIPSQVLGRRIWDPVRLALAGGVLALLVGVAAWGLWPRHAAAPVETPAPAASAAAADPPASVRAPASAPTPTPPASEPAPETVAQRPAASASASAAAASAASSAEAAASDTPPDIRPRLVERVDGVKRPPLLSSKPAQADQPAAAQPAEKTETPAPGRAPERRSEPAPEKAVEAARKTEPADPRLARMAEAPNKLAVALVGPPGSKAEAEALLKKIQEGLRGVHSNPESLQADVIQTPEGWRATVWPFPSREQAQLINATLVARGLKTKAVNF